MRRLGRFLWKRRIIFAFVGLAVASAYAIRQNHEAIDRADRVAVTAAQAARGARDAIHRISREGRERRHQTCLGDENEHLRDVRRLRQTYKFLAGPPPPSPPSLAAIARQQLPQIEADARDRAPGFCDEPGIGLPEPDPVIPKRPRSLR